MRKPYYSYCAEELMERAKLPVKCMESSEQVFKALAAEMIYTVEKNNAMHRHTAIICPVGPVGQYPIFVEAVNARQISLHNCWFFNMDEYLNDDGTYLDFTDRLSFRGFMERAVYQKIHPSLLMPQEQRIFPDPAAPHRLTEQLAALGGADLCIGGIGINGHLAFNEPDKTLTPEAFGALRTRVLTISEQTRTANAIGDLGGAIEEMPFRAVTIGMQEILAAKRIRLGVFRDWHRAVVRRAACGERTAAFPVTLLQEHSDAMIFANDVAASQPI